ncbi:hypothetical protein MRX96_039889 [Rhipicephalus microplus]
MVRLSEWPVVSTHSYAYLPGVGFPVVTGAGNPCGGPSIALRWVEARHYPKAGLYVPLSPFLLQIYGLQRS